MGLLLERIDVLSSVSAEEEGAEVELPALEAALAPRVSANGRRASAVDGAGNQDPRMARYGRGGGWGKSV